MNNKLILAFAKNAAAYAQQSGETVSKAYEIVQENEGIREKLADINPFLVQKLASLTRLNGKPFLPDGMEKQAEDCLMSHPMTAKILDQVLDEFALLKQAYDQLTSSRPPLGSVSQDDRPVRKTAAFDSNENSRAFRNFTERILNM
jgi:hypothetical protein